MPETKTSQTTSTSNEAYYRNNERSDHSRRWGIILIMIGIVWLVFQITSQGNIFNVATGFVEQTEAIAPQTLQGRSLIVMTTSDDVILTGWNGPGIKIEGAKHGFGWSSSAARQELAKLDIQIVQEGDSVRVEVRRPSSSFVMLGRSPYADLRISVPTGVDLNVITVSGEVRATQINGAGRVSTISGDIEMSETQGDLTFHTTSGEISLSDYKGPLNVETVSGEIRLDNGNATSVTINSTSGDILLDGVSGVLKMQTISGDIEVRNARDVAFDVDTNSGTLDFEGSLAPQSNQRINSISGDVTLSLPPDSDLRLDADTTSGELQTDFDLRDETRERRRLSGIVGAGTANLSIETTSGDVRVDADR